MIFIDKDLITNAGVYDFSVTRTIEDTLKWLLININQTIEVRKHDIMSKRLGALSSSAEPRLIWITMLKRPDFFSAKHIFSLACKFNDILESIIAGDKRSHIIKVRIDHNNQNYDRYGNITTIGKAEYWKFMDSEMHDFDRNKTELQPVPPSSHLTQAVPQNHRPARELTRHQHSNSTHLRTHRSDHHSHRSSCPAHDSVSGNKYKWFTHQRHN